MEELIQPNDGKPLNHVIEELNELRHINSAGKEYWLAREIQATFGYGSWDSFTRVIERAQTACKTRRQTLEYHFLLTTKLLPLGKGAQRKVEDYFLSRLACYLIAMEGSPSKIEIVTIKAYFLVQTKKQEDFEAMPEDQKRLAKRKQVASNYTELSKTAVNSGVKPKHMGIFHDKGYRGMYGEKSARSVKRDKGLDEKANLMDFIGFEELAAHDFKNSQTSRQLKVLGINTEDAANDVHYKVGKKVRNTIKELGNPMPETLPLEEDIKKIERRLVKELKAKKS